MVRCYTRYNRKNTISSIPLFIKQLAAGCKVPKQMKIQTSSFSLKKDCEPLNVAKLHEKLDTGLIEELKV